VNRSKVAKAIEKDNPAAPYTAIDSAPVLWHNGHTRMLRLLFFAVIVLGLAASAWLFPGFVAR